MNGATVQITEAVQCGRGWALESGPPSAPGGIIPSLGIMFLFILAVFSDIAASLQGIPSFSVIQQVHSETWHVLSTIAGAEFLHLWSLPPVRAQKWSVELQVFSAGH